MKATIILLLSSVCLLAADDYKKATVVSTNPETGVVISRDFFTRAGHTNLVCSTTSRDGTVRSQLYRFYHDGKHAADYLSVPSLGDSVVDTYNAFDLALTTRSNILTEVTLRDQYERVVDRFVSTNGVFRPVSLGEMREYLTNSAPRVPGGPTPGSR